MIDKAISLLLGPKWGRDLKKLLPLLHRINALESWAMKFEDHAFAEMTQKFRVRLQEGTSLDSLLPEAFAMAREVSRRKLAERPYDVQLLGAITLHKGCIVEMCTGEGKTLSSVAATYLNAISGKGVHVVTVNDYLAKRDAEWMGPVFRTLGLSVGVILSDMDGQAREEAYACDVTYGTNNEFGFDYLRDHMTGSMSSKVQKKHAFAIIDEVDSILIDEARTPLIISGQAQDDTARFSLVDRLISALQECEKDPETGTYPLEDPLQKSTIKGDYKIEEKNKRISFTSDGMNSIERILHDRKLIQGSLYDEENFEFIHYFTQALRARKLFQRDVDYVVQDGQVQIVDEFTGRILHGRRYSEGLHQAIEAKEGIRIAQRNSTLATITFQNFFRMYDKISGMTGTAATEAREFAKIYHLDVVQIPTNRPVIRRDADDLVYLDREHKIKAICETIAEVHAKGQPILVGTISVESSELLSRHLTNRGIRHEVLNAKNHAREALIIGEAGVRGAVTIATNMAGRGTDIKLGGNPEVRALKRVGSDASEEEYQAALAKERAHWEKNNQEVCELGGLYVIGTERHESRRIDNQLRGRSGRQGDPGYSRFYISLDDDLMRLFGRERLKNMMVRLGMSGDEPLRHKIINRSLERAQRTVEDRNYDIRKHLLDFDDVLGKQRDIIYKERNEILSSSSLSGKILHTASEILDILFEDYENDVRQHNLSHAKARLLGRIEQNFHFSIDECSEVEIGELRKEVEQYLKEDLHKKQELAGEERLNAFIRYEFLRNLDKRWQNHLENLEALREAVYLRSYAQKNPLAEYRNEGFDIFDQLIDDMLLSVTRKVFSIRIRREPSEAGYQGARSVSYRHASVPSAMMAQRRAQGDSSEASSPVGAQVRRMAAKVGRNDPCPCGSGKKYKLCHGR